jgi:hypothetical protein
MYNSIVYDYSPTTPIPPIALPAGLTYDYCYIGGLPPVSPNDVDGSMSPDFFNPSPNGDYHLFPYSICVDTGDNTVNSTLQDLDGNPRIQGDRIDLGAYETLYVSPAPLPQEKDKSFNEIKVGNYDLQLFPNPILSGQSLNLQLRNKDGFYAKNALVRVLSTNGKCVYEQPLSNGKLQIDISFFNSGIYFLQVETEDEIYKTKFGIY